MGRQKPTAKTAGIAKAADIEYNEYAGAQKVLGPILGKLVPLGAANTQKPVDQGKTIAFWNSDTATHYVAMGTGTLSAPTGAANGIALPAQSYTLLAMGGDNAFISDSATVFAYEVLDDSEWNPNS